MSRRWFGAVLGVMVAASLVVMPLEEAQAMDLDLEVGARVGPSWNLLSQPRDRAGEWTLLHGSAFSGVGIVLGPEVSLGVTEVADARVQVTGNLLYGFHRGSGFEEHGDGSRIDLHIHAHVLRLPVLVQVRPVEGEFAPVVGLGVEPTIGLVSGATVEQQGMTTPPQPLETRPSSGMNLAGTLGVNWDRQNMVIPVELRFAWNPFVPNTTVDRFDDFQSPDDPGNYGGAFNWQVLLTVGIRYYLGN